MIRHRERLAPPAGWYGAVVVFAVVCGWVVLVAASGIAAVITAIVALTIGIVGLQRTAVTIEVDAERLRVGRASIDLVHVGGVEALDAERMRARMGPGADVRSWLMTRPWVRTGVVVDLNDPDDPVPSWVLSTHRPQQLAEALRPATDPRREQA